MWRAPNRPEGTISQSFVDGLVWICEAEDTAEPGYKPEPKLRRKVKLGYEERKLGIGRYYQAMQNQVHAERVIRVMRVKGISNQDYAETEDGTLYRIDLVQAVRDVYPPCLDLTLARTEQRPRP